mgnify:CR=1 FL=1
MKQKIIKKLSDVINKEYEEKWKSKTFFMILLSQLNIIIVIFLILYTKADINIALKAISETLKTGTLFIISISLITNIVKNKENIAPENKEFLRIITIAIVLIAFLILMFYGASYQPDKDKIELNNYQIIISFVFYLLMIILIGCYNFLNRTDDIRNAVTNRDEEELIRSFKYNTENKGESLKLWLNLNTFW